MVYKEVIFDKESFDKGEELAIRCWTESLAPANGAERRLARSIARQDFLMCVTMKNAIDFNGEPDSGRYLRVQRDLGATLDSLVHALSTLQRQRLSLDPPPPPSTKAKVVPISKRPSAAGAGRPKKVQLDPEPVPNIEPFTSRSRFEKERGSRPSLDLMDLNIAA